MRTRSWFGVLLVVVGLAAGVLLDRAFAGVAPDALAYAAFFVLGLGAAVVLVWAGIVLGGRGMIAPRELPGMNLPARAREGTPASSSPTALAPVPLMTEATAPADAAAVSTGGMLGNRVRFTRERERRIVELHNVGNFEAMSVALHWRQGWKPVLALPTWNTRSIPGMDRFAGGLVLLAVALTLLAQFNFRLLPGRDIPTGPILMFLVAVAAAFAALWRLGWEPRLPVVLAPATAQTWRVVLKERWRTIALGAAIVLTVVELGMILAKVSTDSYTDVFLMWLLACAACGLAFLPTPFTFDLRAWARRNATDIAIALGLTVLALAIRLYAFNQVPDIISGDEGQVGLNALETVTGQFGNMFATIAGHATMYLVVMGQGIELLGNNLTGLRITSAIGGALTIPALYVFSRRMFDRRVAIVAAGILLALHTHVHFSRVIAAGGIQDALFSTIVLWLVYEGLKRNTTIPFVLAGLTMGVYLSVYMGARATVLLVPVYLVALAILRWQMVRANLGNIAAMFLALAISGAPMALWAYQAPDEFNARLNQVGIFATGWLTEQANLQNVPEWQVMLDVIRTSFLTINYFPVTEFYFTTYPLLDRLTAAFFLIGLVYALIHIFDERYLLINAWFWSSVVSGALTIGIQNFSYRILIITPVLGVLAAIGVVKILDLVQRALKTPPRYAYAATGVVLLLSMGLNVRAYWLDWAPTCQFHDAATRFASKMGQYLGTVPRNSQVYLFGAPFVVYGTHPSVDFLSGKLPIKNVETPMDNPKELNPDPAAPMIFVFPQTRRGEVMGVENAFPGGARTELNDCSGNVIVYRVDPP